MALDLTMDGMPSMTREQTSAVKYDALQGCCPFAGLRVGLPSPSPLFGQSIGNKDFKSGTRLPGRDLSGWFQLLKNDSPAGLGLLTSGHLGEV